MQGKQVFIVISLILLQLISCAVGLSLLRRDDYLSEESLEKIASVDIYDQAIENFFTYELRYPRYDEFDNFDKATNYGVLASYIEDKEYFEDLPPGRYYYFNDRTKDPQLFIVCVSFSKDEDIADRKLGGYCSGNGLSKDLGYTGDSRIYYEMLPAVESSPENSDDFYTAVHKMKQFGVSSVWTGKEWVVD